MENPTSRFGDIVIIHDEGLPRGFWKLGRVQRLIVGNDGQTRGATVSVASENRRFTSLNRPLQLLYPLEINHPTVPEILQHPRKVMEIHPTLKHLRNLTRD